MITAAVNAGRETVIRRAVRGTAGQTHHVHAVIDTGYNGWLGVPPATIASLGLPWRRRGLAVLSDRSNSVST